MVTDFSLQGRVFFLCNDPALVRRQLQGENFTRAQAGALRDDISTDEITPTSRMLVFDERLARVPYVGFQCGGEMPIGDGEVLAGGFQVSVGGRRYGKGSSREHSPIAERGAGIRLIVAESFERIYRQNCHNIGLFTSTDYGVLDRLQNGETIPLQEFLDGQDALTQDIIRAGGLLPYVRTVFAPGGKMGIPLDDGPPRSLAEKIIARHLSSFDGISTPTALPAVGESLTMGADWRFSHEYFTGLNEYLLNAAYGDDLPLYDKARIIAFEDHLNLAHRSQTHVIRGLLPGVASLSRSHRRFVDRYEVREYGRLSAIDDDSRPQGTEGSVGICHALMAELHALPGEVVVGTDSHTTHSGALGCLAFGAGSTDIAASWVTGRIRSRMPAVVRIEVSGQLPAGVCAKDLVLHLLALPLIRDGGAIGHVFEYAGEAIERLNMDERCTLTNMVAEMGGMTGIVQPDAETVRFIKERRGVDVVLEPWMCSDEGATYSHHLRIDGASIQPMVAQPGDPGNGVPLASVENRPGIDIAYGGSCTAGKREDFDQYHAVCAWADEQGLRPRDGLRLYLQFGTQAVREYCVERGYLPVFERLGVELLEPGCGACANCGPGSSTEASQVTVSAVNRNFPGRSGPGQVWLAGPATVAASAFLGRLGSFDELKAQASSQRLVGDR